jgi:hypothetical protein
VARASFDFDCGLMKIPMYFEQLTPAGGGLFAEKKSMALIEPMPRQFWRAGFARPPDNGKGDFIAEDVFSPLLIGGAKN